MIVRKTGSPDGVPKTFACEFGWLSLPVKTSMNIYFHVLVAYQVKKREESSDEAIATYP